MLISEQDQLRADIKRRIADLGNNRSALLPILQEVQQKHGHVSEYVLQVLADLLDIHPVEVYGVASFYRFIDHKPKGRFIIRLCRTLPCEMQGKTNVARQLEHELGIQFGETTPDGNFSLEWANCLGMCDQGPALLVNERIHTRVTPESIHDLLEACRKVLGAYSPQERAMSCKRPTASE